MTQNTISKQPIKIQVAVLVTVIVSVITVAVQITRAYSDLENRISAEEKVTEDYQLKQLPVLIKTVESIDEKVDQLLTHK